MELLNPPSGVKSSSSSKLSPPRTSPSQARGIASVTTLAIAAPMCTIGPSGPTASELPHAAATPKTFAHSDLHERSPGMAVPLRYAITEVTPPPCACGAQKRQSDAAASASARHSAVYPATYSAT